MDIIDLLKIPIHIINDNGKIIKMNKKEKDRLGDVEGWNIKNFYKNIEIKEEIDQYVYSEMYDKELCEIRYNKNDKEEYIGTVVIIKDLDKLRHDMKDKMNILSGYTQIMMMDKKNKKQMDKLLMIDKSCKDMLEIIEKFDYIKINQKVYH
jgi:hypothetical protein